MIAISLLGALSLALALVAFQEHLIRRRCERLLADLQSIRLNETSWPQAQAMMKRWGKSGHSHGTCNATDCAYEITVNGWPPLLPLTRTAEWLSRFGGQLPQLLQRVGVRFSSVDLRILVEDGVVRRAGLFIATEASGEDGTSALLVNVRSHSHLDDSDMALHTVGADEELGVHPDFVVSPDGFCSGCEKITLVYTPQLASDELAHLTDFDLSCLTRWRPCGHMPQLAPALVREEASDLREVPLNSVRCTTPTWALARDADAIWLADAHSVGQTPDPNAGEGENRPLVEQDEIQIVSILKGPMRAVPKEIVRFRPYSGTEYQARAVPEHLTRGRRYVLFLSSDGRRDDGVEAGRCGVLEDTPAIEVSIKQGVAMDDHLRSPELTTEWPW
ncbi:MAG TPA: hypothetical protein VHU44_18925 [Acidobacteriaceae bacterium]|nr:hypothetical protein [Acidobacteriaceae bacterium]